MAEEDDAKSITVMHLEEIVILEIADGERQTGRSVIRRPRITAGSDSIAML
ncbi:hypothetical protein DSCO28_54810 [Desulfosarcina ovata subsp. sediminis]|uniref:Uncharacterized protein n=1 Tax=Desulfosarcina ovata subsp. sediminis TaxID=885957 RepID=A0A5K7ZXC4_9BACT|nr:hypothetical protein [Desulfosarcina ovata]BBO84915.1 hypothetical protein DSCO28_54810 [Desulfosarcina ovata subsp. sediminis]